MWADIKAKVNDVNIKSSCLGVASDDYFFRSINRGAVTMLQQGADETGIGEVIVMKDFLWLSGILSLGEVFLQ